MYRVLVCSGLSFVLQSRAKGATWWPFGQEIGNVLRCLTMEGFYTSAAFSCIGLNTPLAAKWRSNSTGVMCSFWRVPVRILAAKCNFYRDGACWHPAQQNIVLLQLRCHKGMDRGLCPFQDQAAPDVGDVRELYYGCLKYALDVHGHPCWGTDPWERPGSLLREHTLSQKIPRWNCWPPLLDDAMGHWWWGIQSCCRWDRVCWMPVWFESTHV